LFADLPIVTKEKIVETEREGIIKELAEQFRPVFEQSPDGVYLWLDEAHKVCNERLATMFGYTVEEWGEAEPFLDTFVAEEDRAIYSWNYHNRVATLAFPATFRFQGLRKDGPTFPAETDLIPISYKGYAVAYHFVRRITE
jgi:PAS domain S-box-containing protein